MISAQWNSFPYKNYRPSVSNPLTKISELCSYTIKSVHNSTVKVDIIDDTLKAFKELWRSNKPASSKILEVLLRTPTSNHFYRSRTSFSHCNFNNGQSVLFYRQRALELQNIYSLGRRTWSNQGQRRYFFQSRKIKRLREEADAHATDPVKQAALLKELNNSDAVAVVKRFESGQFANNEDTVKEYIKALVQLGLFDRVKLSEVLNPRLIEAALHPRVETPQAAPIGDAAAASTPVAEGAAAPSVNTAAFASTGAGAIGSQPFGVTNLVISDAKPVPVKMVTSLWGKILPLLMPLWWFAIIFVLIKLFSGEREPISLFDIPTHHERAEVVDTRFIDVKGCDEAKAELQEVVEYLKNPTKFTEIGAQLPKGILLVGEPGTGKTLLARAIAGEAGVPFFFCSGSSFDEIFVGVGSKRVRALFDAAKKNAPCIVFIDEIDAVGGKRSKWHTGTQDGTLQQLLTELDGFQKNEGIIVIAATNMPESLDAALIRPGRFDKQVVVPVPDVRGRKEILDLYLSKVKTSSDVDSERLARATPGLTGADLSQLVNLAAIKAVIQGMKQVTLSVIEETRDDIWMGRMRKSALVDEKTRLMTAYHEGGHALVALLTEGSDPIHKATIIQRGHALGMVSQLPEGDQLSFTRRQMMAKLAVCMAGRAAEELVYGTHEVTSGASSDFQQATSLAYNMVMKWGMSDTVGFVFLSTEQRKISPETMMLIDKEVKDLLETQYSHAKNVLTKHRHELDTIARALLERETLSGEELKSIIGLG
jgi:ATP-dependent metalloprotease